MIPAATVASELRERLPDIDTERLHMLLYYCQGHHLAWFGEPLFPEAISAGDAGPIVASLWRREMIDGASSTAADASEADLNTIGYVASRYGALSDIGHRVRGEDPWRHADVRRSLNQRAGRISKQSMLAYFQRDAACEHAPPAVTDWLRGAIDRQDGPTQPDSAESLRARIRATL